MAAQAAAPAAVGRNLPLEDLGLPDGSVLEIVYFNYRNATAESQRKLVGRLRGAAIEAQVDGAIRTLTPLEFLRAAGYTARYSSPYKYIRVPSLGGITLADRSEGSAASQTREKERIADLLRSKHGIDTLGQLEEHLKVRGPTRL